MKPVFEKIAKIQRSLYVPMCDDTTFVILSPGCTMTIIKNITIITIFCNAVNKTNTSMELLAINIVRYVSHKEVTLA